jgi:hypothetical protein
MPSNTRQIQKEQARVNRQILHADNRKAANFPTEPQYLFRSTLQRSLDQSISDKVKWLALVNLDLEQAEQRHQDVLAQRRHFNTTFFDSSGPRRNDVADGHGPLTLMETFCNHSRYHHDDYLEVPTGLG